jgi:hypothetical protein
LKTLLEQTLEELEKEYWDVPGYDSYLVARTHALRKKPLKSYTTQDLRIMIGQQFSLSYLVPLALNVLKQDLFAEGDFYEGDLLQAVLNIDAAYWTRNHKHKQTLYQLIHHRQNELYERNIKTSNFDISK